MTKFKIGLIGCGKIAQVEHAPGFAALGKQVEIQGLFDPNTANAKKVKTEHAPEARIYSHIDEFYDHGLDAVVISTPNATHHPLTMQAIDRGCHVIVEKPMATDLQQADEMIRAAKKANKTLMVNQTFRFRKLYQKVKELIDKGRVGNLLHLRCIRTMNGSPNLAWSKGADWFVQKKHGGGLIMDIAVHMADLLGWYAGQAKSMYSINKIHQANREVTDNVTSIIEYQNQVTAVLELSWTMASGRNLLEVHGTEGSILVEDGRLLLNHKGKGYKEIKVPANKSAQKCFLDVINGNMISPSCGEIGKHALTYCKLLEASGSTHQPIAWKQAKQRRSA